jgi:hypothetical protein
MKIIDLLNKIANGEDFEEKHIKYLDRIDQEYDICMICEENIIYKLDEKSIELNDNVEIIEEDKKIEIIEEDKKIEKIDLDSLLGIGYYEGKQTLAGKINEIIDHINKED